MVAYPYRAPGGIPGAQNRVGAGNTIESHQLDTTVATPFAAYGLACVIDQYGARPVVSSDTAISGFLDRPFPLQATVATGYSGSVSLAGPAVPPTKGEVDVLRRGYMTVLLGNPTAQPAPQGAVYVWIAASTGAHVQGQVEAAATAGSTIALDSKSYFTGASDSAGNVEIAFNI